MSKNNSDPPDKWILLGFAIVNILILAFIAWVCYNTLKQPETSPEGRIRQEYIVIQGNSLKASSPVNHIEPRVLGIMTNGLSIDEAILLNKIAECESGWREDVCNSEYGCRGGQGLFQIISSTAKTCEKNLGRPINPFNEQDSLDCAIWLLTETSQGYYHWGTPTSWWGSYWCWHTAIP